MPAIRPAQVREARHIALVLPTLGLGGAEHNLMKVLRAMVARGHRLDLVAMRAEGPLLEDMPPQARLIDLGRDSKPGSIRPLARYLRAHRPQTVLSAMASVNCVTVMAQRLSGHTAHLVLSERSNLSREVAQDLRRRILPPLMRRLYPRADRLLAVSGGVADDLSAMIAIDRGRIEVLHNPVLGPELLSLAAVPPADPWFAEPGPPVILAVGRLHRQKDYPTLLRAFALLRGRRDCRLMILGEGAQRNALEAQVAAFGLTGAVRLPGILRHPYGHMAGCAVFVLSSLWEGLPTALIEAMACGAPVVSTDCDSGPREILMDGMLGPLVPPGDPAALAEALERQMARPRPVSYPLDRFREAPIFDRYEAILCGEP